MTDQTKKCEKNLTSKQRCCRPAVAFVMGQHRCVIHDPKGLDNCSHSLAPSGRCSYCGAVQR